MGATSASTPHLHPTLSALLGALGREDARTESEPHWVSFLSDDAYIEAEIKPGDADVMSIDAFLLTGDAMKRSQEDVEEWIARQPVPAFGLLRDGTEVEPDDSTVASPLFTLDISTDLVPGAVDAIYALIHALAAAWDGNTVAVLPDAGDAEVLRRDDPVLLPPRNAWLLKGDEASFRTTEDLEEMEVEARAGVLDTLWTAPKNGELGDLVLFYFQAPRKAAHFVARLASDPYWTDGIDVNAIADVARQQWWAYTTPLIEIEPIPFQALQAAHDGHLILKGRSGHYLPARTIDALTFRAVRPEKQAALERVVRPPVGLSDLPAAGHASFENWKQIPSGLLPLEAKVSEHIVEPLMTILLEAPAPNSDGVLQPTLGPFFEPQYRVPSGFVDFVFEYGWTRVAALAVEVKLTMIRPQSTCWMDSLDFRQLRRHMDDLDTPGVLIDAHRLLLVRPGADQPFQVIVRADATWDDMSTLRDLLLDGWRRKEPLVAQPPSRIAGRRILNRD